MDAIDQKSREYCGIWQSLNLIYEDYARKAGVSYNSLYILNTIATTEGCTQKHICEKTLLPKQTVNNVITSFYKSGYIALTELPENRRIKTIRLTEQGKAYADTLIPTIHQADRLAMQALTEAEQDTLLLLTKRYVAAFEAAMLGD